MIRITKSLLRTKNKGTVKRLLPLLLLIPMLFVNISLNAQDKIWDFGNNSGGFWPIASATSTINTTIDGLTLVAGGSNFAQIASGSATFTDGYSATNRFSTGGASAFANNLPTKRYLSFPVTGACVVKIWLGATATGRTTFVSNGSSLLASNLSSGSGSPYAQIVTINYTGNSGTIYIYADNAVYLYKIALTYPILVTTPTLTADTSANTVDNNLDITSGDATWGAAISAVKIGTTTLSAGDWDKTTTPGVLTLKPSNGNMLLRTPGSKSITVLATGYANATITQEILAGTPTSANSTVAISGVLGQNITRTITATAKDQYNNLVSGYGFKYAATITNNGANTTEAYLIDGAPKTSSTSDIAINSLTLNGVATFDVTIPTVIDPSDGISIQVKLNDGTSVGSTFSFTQLAAQSINFGSLNPVTYGDGTFNLTATTSSSLPVSYASSNTAVATISGATVTIVGPGVAVITASQSGSTDYNAAFEIHQNLIVNQKNLTIDSPVAVSRPYNATTVATITGTLSGIVGADAVTFSGTGTFADANVGTGIVVSNILCTLGGANANKYTLSQPSDLSADITKADQTIVFAASVRKTQGFADSVLGATSSTSLVNPITYTSSNTEVATIVDNLLHFVGIGTTQITASQAGNENYNAALDVVQTLSITPTPIAAWNFFTPSSSTQYTKVAYLYNSDLDATSTTSVPSTNGSGVTTVSLNTMSRGSGLTASGGTSTIRGVFPLTSATPTLVTPTNNAYLQITIKPNAGKKVSLTTIDAKFYSAGISGTTPAFEGGDGATSQFGYILSNSTSTGSLTAIGSPVTSTSLTMGQIDLSNIAELQNVSAGTTITLRYYASGQSTRGWGFKSSTTSSDDDGLVIGGRIESATPATPVVTVVNNCDGTSVLSTNASGTLAWSTGATTSSITVSNAGNYTVTQTVSGLTSLEGLGVAEPKLTSSPISETQVFCPSVNATVANLVATGEALQWYASANDGAPLASDFALVSGTYYVTQNQNSCESFVRTAVSVIIDNGITSQPLSTSICKVIGGTALLSVVSANPNATYQWETQSPTGTTWANVTNPSTGAAIYTGGTSADLSIRKSSLVLPLSSTKYRVKVTGSCSSEASNIVTITDAVLPTEVVGAITSTTSAATTTGFAAATLAVGPFVGTQTTVSYRIPAFTGSGLTYYWTVPAGVSIVGQASGVTSVTQNGADVNILNVNFSGVATGIGTIGSITVQAQNANGCKTTAKSVILTKALPAAPTAIKMTDALLPLPISGVATAVTSFAKYMGTTKVLTLTAAPSATATSYSWELPAGVTQLSGGNSNVITVNFADVTSSNTDSYTTTAGVLTYVTRIGVKSVNGVGNSVTANTALLNPTTPSTAKLLTLTAVAPAAPATLKMTNNAVSTSTAVTIISKFIGTSTEFTLTAAASALASSYSWEIPTGVNVIQGSDLASNTIKVNFANVNGGTTSLYLGVKAVNGVGSSVTNNSATTVLPTTDSSAKLLKVTATAPLAPATLVLNDVASSTPTTAVTVVSKYIGTITTLKLTAGTSVLANTYEWTLPTGVNRTDANGVSVAGSTSDTPIIYVNFANVPHENTAISLVFGVKAVNGFGSSTSVNVAPNAANTSKLLTVTAGAPAAVATVGGLLSVCNRSEGYNYTITAPVGATYYLITAPVGSVVSSVNGVSGSTPNVMTTSDLTFKVVYSGTTAFPTTDKSLSIKSGNAFGLSATAKALALVKLATCPTTTGKFEMVSSDEFKVVAYPNPYASTFQLNFTTTSESQVEMRVYDMIGKLVEARQFSTTEMNNQEVGTNYPSGIYNVIVTQGENVKTLRVIKR